VAGISRQQVYVWRGLDDAFSHAWDEALDHAYAVLESTMYRRALDGDNTASIYLHKVFEARKAKAEAREKPRGEPVEAPTLESIFGDELHELDLGSRKGWLRIASALKTFPIQDVTAMLIRISDQLLKIDVVHTKGIGGAELSKLRALFHDVIHGGELTPDGNGNEPVDDEDD
jgi:hypothetical protein